MKNFNIERFITIQNECDKYETGYQEKESNGKLHHLISMFVPQNKNKGNCNYNRAFQELESGKKRSHWIWYIFPQLKGIGHSSMSNKYGIVSLQEAEEYYKNETLCKRLREITKVLLSQNDNVENIFGALDARKVCSCMTLFDLVSPNDIFDEVLSKFYHSKRCQKTISLLKNEMDNKNKGTVDNKNNTPGRMFRGIV